MKLCLAHFYEFDADNIVLHVLKEIDKITINGLLVKMLMSPS